MAYKYDDEVVEMLEGSDGMTPTQIGVALGMDRVRAAPRMATILSRLVDAGRIKRCDLTGTARARGRRGRFVVYMAEG